MPLLLVLHDGDAEAAEALEAAVWQLSESHWSLGTGLMVVTGVSPAYLSDHLARALERAAQRASLLVTRVTEDVAVGGLPEEGRNWIVESLAPPG